MISFMIQQLFHSYPLCGSYEEYFVNLTRYGLVTPYAITNIGHYFLLITAWCPTTPFNVNYILRNKFMRKIKSQYRTFHSEKFCLICDVWNILLYDICCVVMCLNCLIRTVNEKNKIYTFKINKKEKSSTITTTWIWEERCTKVYQNMSCYDASFYDILKGRIISKSRLSVLSCKYFGEN